MSDFSRQSHDFRSFIGSLTKDMPNSDDSTAAEQGKDKEAKPDAQKTPNVGTKEIARTKSTIDRQVGLASLTGPLQPVPTDPAESDAIRFEDVLFYVCLPDLNYFKDPPHAEIRRLFKWLQHQGVNTIRHLCIPDSTTAPMHDVLVSEDVMERFKIEKFEWRKLDINLEVLTESMSPADFTELTLYSSGNWSVLYHWASNDGLKQLTGVSAARFMWRTQLLHSKSPLILVQLTYVTIVIVALNPSNVSLQ